MNRANWLLGMNLKKVYYGIVVHCSQWGGWALLESLMQPFSKYMSLTTRIPFPLPQHTLSLSQDLISWGRTGGIITLSKPSRVILISTLIPVFSNFAAHCNHPRSFKNNPKSYPTPVKLDHLKVEARQLFWLLSSSQYSQAWDRCLGRVSETQSCFSRPRARHF